MKRALSYIMGVFSALAVILVLPGVTGTEAEAKNDSSDIVGTWIRLYDGDYYEALQFTEEGIIRFYNKDDGRPIFGSFSFENNVLTVEGKEFDCYVEGNGLITNYSSGYFYIYTRA